MLDEAGNWRVDERVGARGQAVWAGLAAGGGGVPISHECAAPLGWGCGQRVFHPGLHAWVRLGPLVPVETQDSI